MIFQSFSAFSSFPRFPWSGHFRVRVRVEVEGLGPGFRSSSRRHGALCDFEKNKNDKLLSQVNNDCNESCNFISPVNKVLLQTTIPTVENDSFQYYARVLFDNGSQSSYITPKLCEKLNLKTIAFRT